jgi:HEPN domain-containing protein
MQDDTKSWEFFAENGIISARKLLDIPRLTGEVAFHCQQSIEKYFKAYLFKHNRQIPFVKTPIPHLFLLHLYKFRHTGGISYYQ